MSPKPSVGAEVAAKVARILDEKGIAYVLFGYVALSLYGTVTNHPDVDFVDSDNMIPSATKALVAEG
ncbi:uncharacterized protein BDV17DRAFT_287198 [Aspergillus undulatus]|uniref:uncharacterized protein n=1 Tax=Aspergillus undulatus TaxID=1810928 RepID=UPI003CCCED34